MSRAQIEWVLVPLNLIVWAKTNAGMGSLYRSQHELLPLFTKGSRPHVKPTAMLEDALLDLTHRGDLVIDPFLGSGSTLIAARHIRRLRKRARPRRPYARQTREANHVEGGSVRQDAGDAAGRSPRGQTASLIGMGAPIESKSALFRPA